MSALAGPADRSKQDAPRAAQRGAAQQADPRATTTASPTPDGAERRASSGEDSKAGSSRAARSTGEGRRAEGDKARQGNGEGNRERRAARRATATASPKSANTRTQDPRGNNGTIKIDGVPFDDSKGNEPHVGCDVRVVFWGFDAGDTASITFTGQAPTGGGVLHSESGTLISRDAAGGGQDLDEALVFSVDGALSELTSIAPHPQQGWHVKVAVDVDSAPGGAKQKVFWMSCPTTVAAAAAAPTETTLGAAGVSGTTVAAPARRAQRGAAAPAAPELTLGAGTVEVADQSAVTGTTSGAASAVARAGSGAAGDAGGAAGSARAADRPSTLPFTGPAALGALLSLGLGSLLAGGLAHRLGRRRTGLASA